MNLKDEIILHEVLGVCDSICGGPCGTTASGIIASGVLTVQDEGITITTAAGVMNFIGDDVQAELVSGVINVSVTGPSDLGLKKEDNILWMEDTDRSKWLSVDRTNLIATRNRIKDAYLWASGKFALSKSGYTMRKDGTIIGMSITTDNSATWSLEVRRNNVATSILTVPVTSSKTIRNDLDTDFQSLDEIQLYCNTGGQLLQGVVVVMDVAWRL